MTSWKYLSKAIECDGLASSLRNCIKWLQETIDRVDISLDLRIPACIGLIVGDRTIKAPPDKLMRPSSEAGKDAASAPRGGNFRAEKVLLIEI
jgi:hypothetical protein